MFLFGFILLCIMLVLEIGMITLYVIKVIRESSLWGIVVNVVLIIIYLIVTTMTAASIYLMIAKGMI